jgi:plastocyanin
VLSPITVSADAGRRFAHRRQAGSAVLAVAVLSVVLAACGSSGNKSSTATTAAPATTGGSGSTSVSATTSGAATTSGGAAPAAAITIVIQSFAFHPANFSVSPGATITVRNEDSAPHTLTASNRSFTTGQINPGKTGTVKAPTAAGTYPYICLIHNFMTGVLTVK